VIGGSPWQGDPPVGRPLEPWFFWYEDTEASKPGKTRKASKPAPQPDPDAGHRGSRARLVRRPVATAAVLAGLLAIVGGAVGLTRLSGHPGDAARPLAKSSPAPRGTFAAAPQARSAERVARPVALAIPAVGVRTTLETLGRTPQGTLQVPVGTTVAGWYTGSPRPGGIGSSIIVGHIDSAVGPGIFFRLRLLRPGDLVYVRRADGTLVVFRVYAEHMYAKAHFPTEAVYGPVPDAELHLITCGGVFDSATGSYLSNVVVYASQVSVRQPRHHHHGRRHGHHPRARHS
jgi:sortase (surface protein transpeptidase)